MPDSSLRDSSAQLAQFGSALFESSPDCVKLLDPSGNIVAMNQNGQCAMEIDNFELVRGRAWVDLWPVESHELIRQAVQQANAGGVGFFHSFCPTAKGAPRWWDVTITCLFPGGAGRQMLAVSRDVSAAHNAARELRASEARYRSLVTATSAIVWNTAPSGHFHGEQASWAAFTGQTYDQYLGNGWLGAVHPDDQARTIAVWQAALASGQPYAIQHRVRRADGEYRHMSVRGVPVHADDGSVREWVGVDTDITDSVQAAAERERLMAQVRASSERLEAAFRESPSFMCIQRGPDHVFEMFNESYSEIVGGRAVVGKSLRDLLPEIDGQGYFEKRDEVFATGEPFVGTNLPVYIAGPDGGPPVKHYIDVRYSALRAADGTITGVMTHGIDQTERRVAELARQANQERLLLATEAGELGLWSWRPGLDQIVWENARPYAILGIGPDDPAVPAASFIEHFVHPDDAAGFAQAIRCAVQEGRRFVFQGRLRPRGEAVRWVECVGRAQPAKDGTPLQLIGTIADITERKIAEIALFESRERFQKIVDQAATGVVQSDADGRISFVNQKYCDMLGYREEELLGRSVLDFTAPAYVQITRDAIGRLKRSGKGVVVDQQYLHKDGSTVWATSSVNALSGRNGEFQGLVAIVLDVTDRQAAVEELSASEQRYRTLFNSTDQGVCIVDMVFAPDGTCCDYLFVESNSRFHEQSGLPDEAVGRTARELMPNLEQHWFDAFGEVARTGRPVRFESDSAALGGRWFDIFATPMAGKENRIAILFRDVTERRHAEESLRILAADLSEADRRKTEFLATLAHELRNPLAPIRSGLHVMRLGGDSPVAVGRVREMLERQVQHMVHLIDDLLDIARISSGKLDLRQTRSDVVAILGNAVETSMPLIEARQHTLTIDIPDTPLEADVDVHRIAQVVSNLLNNAAKYTPPGGRIHMAARAEHHEIVVTVSDSGVGIPAESLSSVFDMFAQIDRDVDRAQGGLGIGLSLVNRLVRMHGGSVRATSPGLGHGSTFEVRLPLLPSVPATFLGAAISVPAAHSRRKVLVVDDNTDAASTLSMILEALGHDSGVAGSGEEALQLVANGRPDALFLDIGMPGMDGYETARAIRALPGMESVVLVALTGWGAAEDRQRSKEAGFNHHLTKPVELAAVESILDRLA